MSVEKLLAANGAPDEFEDANPEAPTKLIIVGEDGVDEVLAPKPIQEMSVSEQKELADNIVAEIDDHDEGLPFLPLNLGKFTVWSFENCFLPVDDPDDKPDSNPGIIITFASPDDPRGTPYILNRDRGLKFASQLKKRLLTGPVVSLQQRAAQSGLAVPPAAGELIVPGR